jgi:ABC-type transporter Mla MlaB component
MGVLHGSSAARHRDHFTVSSAPHGRVQIAVAGTLGPATALRLWDAFNGSLDAGARAVLVDLSAVDAVDAHVLHTLLGIVDQAHSVALEFRLGAAVERLLALGGVRHHLLGCATLGGPVTGCAPGRRRRCWRRAS